MNEVWSQFFKNYEKMNKQEPLFGENYEKNYDIFYETRFQKPAPGLDRVGEKNNHILYGIGEWINSITIGEIVSLGEITGVLNT